MLMPKTIPGTAMGTNARKSNSLPAKKLCARDNPSDETHEKNRRCGARHTEIKLFQKAQRAVSLIKSL